MKEPEENPYIRDPELEYFASEQAMDIEGLGEKVAEQLVDEGLVT